MFTYLKKKNAVDVTLQTCDDTYEHHRANNVKH